MKPYRVPKWLVIVSTVIFFILIASGYGFFQAQQNSMRVIAERDLFAVANSKLDQITLWRENQLAEGVELMSSVHLKRGLENWIRRRDAEGEEIIRTRMQSLVEHYHYQEILLLTPDGRQLMSFTGKRVTLHPEMLEALSEAQDKLRPILSDIHFGKPFDFPHITLAVPMALDEDDQTTLLGYFLLVIDANDFLYPLIQSWPLPSETAETLLIRQDGDDALFLNELRHLPDTAFNLRIPLTEVNVPAVKAILEENGIVEGLDYRGVPVIAAIQPVPDTTWFMVSKIDQAEALAVWRTNAALIVLMILGGMGTAGGFAGFIWQRDAKHHFLELAQSELARRESEERHRVTLMSVGDAVIVTDPDGTVQLMNPVAEYLTGWPLGEASGKPLEEVFHIINEESRQRVENHAKKVMREGNVVGLANHTLLVSRDGLEYPIADSGAPIRFEQGEISGVVLVFRDQSEEHEAQHRLEESEKKFRTYFESSPTAISLTSPEGKYIGVNRAYCKMTGYTEEEVIGKPATNFTYADDRQEFEGRMSDSLTGNQRTHQIEKRLVVKNGEILWVAGNTNLITDGDGKPLFFLSHMINITHQKEAEEKLKISEERFRVAQEISPDGFTILHPVDFTWVYENQTIAKINGTDPEEVIGQQLLSIFPDHSGTPVFEAYLDVANTNKNRILEEVYVGEILSKPTWLRLVLVSMDEDIAILAQDITERKLAEKQLQERNDFIQTILDNLPMGIAVNSVASGVDFSYMNDKFLEFYRTTRAALAQTDSFWEAVYEDEELREEIRQRVIRDTSSGDVNRMQWDDIPIQRKGEKTTYISARNIPIQRNELMVSVVWDSTHRREAEEAIRELNVNLERKVEEHTHELKEAQEKLLRQERLAVLGQLAGSVSHELRNPLGVISNSIYILSTLLKDADDKAKEYLQMINEETKRSEKIISDMLDFSKVRIPDARAFGIDEAIQSVLGRMTIPKNIGIVKNLESTLPSAFADPLHIAQILDNILINAVQAMPTGGELTISVSLHWQERNEFLRLEVKDSGEGMSDEVLSKIFEPLFTTKARGIGLGLPLSKSLIEANGGWIEAKSQAGQGSTFIVYIPTYQEEEK
jgi:PAS domain S-box-containing protein